MKIVVYYLSAEDGGGLFVLKKFYQDVLDYKQNDLDWYFIVSVDCLKDTERVKIVKHKKNGYLKRFVYERFILHKEVNKINPDLIISLQNMPIYGCTQKQYVYMHQSLQFCEKQFSFLKRQEFLLAFRQHIICEFYRRSLPISNHIFVQTDWIKNAVSSWIGCSLSSLTVVPVTIDYDRIENIKYEGKESKVFFYPARAEIYKNHDCIIEACRLLEEEGFTDYKVILTLDKNESIYTRKLAKKAIGLPIEFIGKISYEKVWNYYSKSILLFSSYLETCGLPLVEAMTIGSRIIVSDLPYAHDVLAEYSNVTYFVYNDPKSLAQIMRLHVEKPFYKPEKNVIQNQNSLMKSMLDLFNRS